MFTKRTPARGYHPETRARRRNAIHSRVGVEFLDEDDAQLELLEPEDGTRGARWPTRAAVVGLVALVLIAVAVIHNAGLPAKKTATNVTHSATGPLFTCGRIMRVPAGDVPSETTRTINRTLPGIRINDAVVRVACLFDEPRDPRLHVVGAPPTVLTRSLDARYKGLPITVEIRPGKPSSGTTMQTVASGASNAYIIHNRRRSARRTVTVTVIAAPRTHIPVRRLQRLANHLARLPRLAQRSNYVSRARSGMTHGLP